jgi:hypothetical protein
MTIEERIGRLVAGGYAKLLASTLQEHPEVDILYDDGSFFTVAAAHSEIEVLKVLFDVFNARLPKDTNSHECLHLKLKLSNILHAAIDSSSPSEDTVLLMKQYMYDEDDGDSRNGDDVLEDGDADDSSRDHDMQEHHNDEHGGASTQQHPTTLSIDALRRLAIDSSSSASSISVSALWLVDQQVRQHEDAALLGQGGNVAGADGSHNNLISE